LESNEKKKVCISIFVGGASTLSQILKLCANKRELFIVTIIVKLIVVPVLIPHILVANNRNIGVTTILEVQRGKLGFVTN
jgi:hypothetical protein